MKSKKEIKDEVARKNRWADGFDILTILESGTTDLEHIIDEAMEEYLQQGIAHFISSKQDVIKSVCEHDYNRMYIDQESIFVCTKCRKRQGSSQTVL